MNLQRLTNAVLAIFIGGVMTGVLAGQINSPTPPAEPSLRIGTVLASPVPTADKVSVQVFASGDPLRLPYQTGYVPVAGDLVNVLLLGGSSSAGIVLGGRASQAGNLVVNGNFYRAPSLDFPPVNAPPYHWFRYVASGNAAVVCQAVHQTYQRLTMVVSAQTGVSSGDTYAYSSAFPVVAGTSYKLTSFGHISTNASTTVTVQSRIAFFGDGTTAYPGFASETQYGTDAIGASASTDIYHFGTVVAPTGATYAQIALRANHAGSGAGSGSNMYWSEVIALKV